VVARICRVTCGGKPIVPGCDRRSRFPRRTVASLPQLRRREASRDRTRTGLRVGGKLQSARSLAAPARVVTHVSGMNCHPSLRKGHSVRFIRLGNVNLARGLATRTARFVPDVKLHSNARDSATDPLERMIFATLHAQRSAQLHWGSQRAA